MRPRLRAWWAFVALPLLLPATAALAQPTIHLLTQNSQGVYAAVEVVGITEGAHLRFRAASDENTSVTVTFRAEADANAIAMGYESETYTRTFTDNMETPHVWQSSHGNSTDETYGTITVTLLRGSGYRVGAPSVVRVGIVDNDGDRHMFRDCDGCPEMVALPAGTFTMGSPDDETGRFDHEGPQHTVTISPFAVGRYEVTFAEYDACRTAGGCPRNPADGGWGRGTQPAADIHLRDADNYVKWLSKKTGDDYRLLSEAEWEYAARAGSTMAYSWGATAGSGNANCTGCGGDYDVDGSRQTAPVNSYTANAFGLYNMLGNVQEWVADCWHGSYENAPTDGRVWRGENGGNCDHRVVRGGSYLAKPAWIRSAYRNAQGGDSDKARLSVGFRVAKTSPVPAPPPPPPTPDMNDDDEVNANDALILYYSYSLRSDLGTGR